MRWLASATRWPPRMPPTGTTSVPGDEHSRSSPAPTGAQPSQADARALRRRGRAYRPSAQPAPGRAARSEGRSRGRPSSEESARSRLLPPPRPGHVRRSGGAADGGRRGRRRVRGARVAGARRAHGARPHPCRSGPSAWSRGPGAGAWSAGSRSRRHDCLPRRAHRRAPGSGVFRRPSRSCAR